MRIDLKATLDRARIALQLTSASAIAVTPQPQTVDCPTLLADVPTPTLRAYPKATVVAEKLHAVSNIQRFMSPLPRPPRAETDKKYWNRGP